MFIKDSQSGYDRDGQQKAHGFFLILMTPDLYALEKEKGLSREERLAMKKDHKKDMRAVIRFCRMSQLGHFMMGKVRIGGESYSVTGTYGNNGLPKTMPMAVYEKAVSVPEELYDVWANGGGHHSAGKEGPLIRDWALDNFDELHQAGT